MHLPPDASIQLSAARHHCRGLENMSETVLHLDLTMSDRELSLFVATRCSEAGTVRSIKIHRLPRPFALVEMASRNETLELAALYGRSAFANCVLFHLEQERKAA